MNPVKLGNPSGDSMNMDQENTAKFLIGSTDWDQDPKNPVQLGNSSGDSMNMDQEDTEKVPNRIDHF